MDPQIIDYYNEMPHEVNVIDKMNEELGEVQKENDNLKKKIEEYDKIMKTVCLSFEPDQRVRAVIRGVLDEGHDP